LCDLPRLVVAAQQEDAVAIPHCAAGKGGELCLGVLSNACAGWSGEQRMWSARSRAAGSAVTAYPLAQQAA
jgi:hypothetical protein